MALQPTGAVIQLIEAMGYTHLDDEIHAYAGDYFAGLMQGSQLITGTLNELRARNMSEEDRKKQELIKKNQEEYKAKMKAEQEYKRQLEENSQKERKWKQQ